MIVNGGSPNNYKIGLNIDSQNKKYNIKSRYIMSSIVNEILPWIFVGEKVMTAL